MSIRTDSFGKGERALWGDFPKVLRNAELGELQKYTEYQLAKTGDKPAADKLVGECFKKKTLQDIFSLLSNKDTLLTPVLAQEIGGKNQIPLAVAHYLSKALNLPIGKEILQLDKIYRTNKGSDFRLLFSPVFAGKVEKGRDYFLIDDTLTMGGTLASLHGYIKNRGGNVLGAFVMTAHESSLSMPVKQEMIDKIDAKHGQELRSFWRNFFAYEIDMLTQAEAGHLLKAESVQSITNRMKETYIEHIFSATEF